MNDLKYTSIAVALAAALGLAACGERSEPQLGPKADPAAGQALPRSESSIPQPPAQAQEGSKDAGAGVPGALAVGVPDSDITAAVKAELAKDEQLGTLKIDVDTSNGKVALKGNAPTAVVRDRATQVALAVRGVAGVDNQLVVGSS